MSDDNGNNGDNGDNGDDDNKVVQFPGTQKPIDTDVDASDQDSPDNEHRITSAPHQGLGDDSSVIRGAPHQDPDDPIAAANQHLVNTSGSETEKGLLDRIASIAPQKLRDAASNVDWTNPYVSLASTAIVVATLSSPFWGGALIKNERLKNQARSDFITAIEIPENAPHVTVQHTVATLYDLEDGTATFYDFEEKIHQRIQPKNQTNLYPTPFFNAPEIDFDLAADPKAQAVLTQACSTAEKLANLNPELDWVAIRTNYLAPYHQDNRFTSEYMRLMGDMFFDRNCKPSGL